MVATTDQSNHNELKKENEPHHVLSKKEF